MEKIDIKKEKSLEKEDLKAKKVFSLDDDSSVLDESNKCVRVPIGSYDEESSDKGTTFHFDVNTIVYSSDVMARKYSSKKFNGRWDLYPRDGKAKEVLFFYE